jgi:hypothetical protein
MGVFSVAFLLILPGKMGRARSRGGPDGLDLKPSCCHGDALT